jgi:hypothetical protein
MKFAVLHKLLLAAAGVGASLILSGCLSSGAGDDITEPAVGIIDFPVAFIQKPYPRDNMGEIEQPDIRDPLQFSEGGDLFLMERATLGITPVNITSVITGGQGDVKDLDVSFDGKKFIFSLRLFDPNPNDDDTPTWDIYEYDVELQQLRMVMSPSRAELGDDVDPHYLSDGRIVFSSNRQAGAQDVLGTEEISKPFFAAIDEDNNVKIFNLHVMDEDGTNIEQLTYNQSHDLEPVVMNDGSIVYVRWDNYGGQDRGMSLYRVLPDGTGNELLYGRYSHDTGTNGSTVQFTDPQPLPNGRVLTVLRPYTGTFGGGDLVEVDINSYVDNTQALTLYSGTLSGPAQVPMTVNAISTDPAQPSAAGRYAAAFRLVDGTDRMLVSKSFCSLDINGVISPCTPENLNNPVAEEVPPDYSIWMYNLQGNTERPVLQAVSGEIISDIVVGQQRTLPPLASSVLNPDWEAEGVGVIKIRSVYDFDGSFNALGAAVGSLTAMSNYINPAANRPARFIRLVKAVGIPDPDDEDLIDPPDLANEAFGPNRNLGMREILGYSMVDPDGSVMVKVPANVPFTIDVLDEAGRRIGPRHNSWMQVRAGETRVCNGCHTIPAMGDPLPHGRVDAAPTPVNQGSGSSLPYPLSTGLGTNILLEANPGENMSEVRYTRCNLDGVPCSIPATSISPSVALNYTDVWAPSLPSVNPDFLYSYGNLEQAGEIFDPMAATPLSPPTSAACQHDPADSEYGWEPNCRIVINYVDHIHPLWTKPRGADTCVDCHSTRDAMNQLRVPAGQLNLGDSTDDPNADNMGQEHAYRELFFADEGQEINGMGQLVSITITVPLLDGNGDPVLDGMGNPVTIDIPDPAAAVTPSMSANGARVSYFMEKMNETELDAGRTLSTTVDHSGFMSQDELKLVAEWLDIGGQYFNNPFDLRAPQN